jgi:hypothetical protein
LTNRVIQYPGPADATALTCQILKATRNSS